MGKFKVGDRVDTANGKGVIIEIDDNDYKISVKHDTYNRRLHSMYGKCENGHGWWYVSEEIRRDNESI